jgi:glycosyltransferase involved in cell wall biosynthesis
MTTMINTVSINGRFLSRKPTGVDRFACEVLTALDQMVADQEAAVANLSFQILVPSQGEPKRQFAHLPTRRIGKRAGQMWEQWDLALAARGGLLVNLCNTAPLWGARQLTVIHDAATARVPESYGRLFRLWYGLVIPAAYKRSVSVCTVSQFARADLASLYGPRVDVRVLPEGTEHMAIIASDSRLLATHGLQTRPYVLAVSSLSPHKNFAVVMQAVALMGNVGFDVVIAGGQNPRVFSSTAQIPACNVKYLGYVSDGELKALYENAACFVFPSLYEGYGLPPTEAMACGCPVVAARAASIPEVCGDAALYFDPRQPLELAQVLKQLLGNSSLRDDLRARGLARAATLRWRDAAAALLEEICRVTKTNSTEIP